MQLAQVTRAVIDTRRNIATDEAKLFEIAFVFGIITLRVK
jgi:hypothetical protein